MDPKLLTVIISLIVAIIGIPIAILQLRKAYIDNKKRDIGGGAEMNKKTKNTIKNENDGDVSNVVITGDVSINKTNINNPTTTIQQGIEDDNIILKSTYTSLFAENGEVHSEKITIRNLPNGKIEGEVKLDDTYIYTLTGTFKNRVLTGEFTSIGNYTDERGTINLKQISENILSGFCSFSKITSSSDDQIRMSPYVWVAGENSDIVHGTYEFCTTCHNQGKKCCCASSDIDMPILLQNEARKLQSMNPRHQRMHDFSRAIGNTPIRQINSITSSTCGTHCHFYVPADNRCKIYDQRPTDCKLFPFDIKLDTNTNEYWVGYYSNLCENSLPDNEQMKLYAHVLRPLLFLLFPYANTINRSDVCEKLNYATFEKLYKLQQFIF